jgi:aminotransferase
MSVECDKAGGINLSQGICDMGIPPVLSQGAKTAFDLGQNHYTHHEGITELRQAIAHKLFHFNKIQADPDENIVVTCGATGAFYSACLALLNPGDEVLIFEPFYGYHVYTLLALDIVPVYAKLKPPLWSIDMNELEGLITSNTKGIIINTPANPSGKVFSKVELELLASFCLQHSLLIFTDEIYEYIVYDGLQHISPGSISGISDRVITISGYSKTFSITGWRIGYSVCQKDLSRPIGYASDLVYVCAPAPLQQGVAAAVEGLTDEYYRQLCSSYERKRDIMCTGLREAELMPYVPQGAYYVLADCSRLPGSTSKEKAMILLEQTGVAAVPGSAFYHDQEGENLLRFCFAKEDDILNMACERLRKHQVCSKKGMVDI